MLSVMSLWGIGSAAEVTKLHVGIGRLMERVCGYKSIPGLDMMSPGLRLNQSIPRVLLYGQETLAETLAGSCPTGCDDGS